MQLIPNITPENREFFLQGLEPGELAEYTDTSGTDRLIPPYALGEDGTLNVNLLHTSYNQALVDQGLQSSADKILPSLRLHSLHVDYGLELGGDMLHIDCTQDPRGRFQYINNTRMELHFVARSFELGVFPHRDTNIRLTVRATVDLETGDVEVKVTNADQCIDDGITPKIVGISFQGERGICRVAKEQEPVVSTIVYNWRLQRVKDKALGERSYAHRIFWKLVAANGEILVESRQGSRDMTDARRAVRALAYAFGHKDLDVPAYFNEILPGRKPKAVTKAVR